MKILETRSAPNPRRVRIFLAEKGLIIPFEELDLMAGQLRSERFTKLNPYQRVPVLILEDGTALSETVAICRYFEDLVPEPVLFGSSPKEKAIIEMWNRRMELGLFQAITHVFRHLHPKMAHLERPQIKEWGEANKSKVLEHLKILDEHLHKSSFIAGGEFSIADITAFVALSFMKPAKIDRPVGHKHLDIWYEKISLRPSASA